MKLYIYIYIYIYPSLFTYCLVKLHYFIDLYFISEKATRLLFNLKKIHFSKEKKLFITIIIFMTKLFSKCIIFFFFFFVKKYFHFTMIILYYIYFFKKKLFCNIFYRLFSFEMNLMKKFNFI
jgi:hypothetical protein